MATIMPETMSRGICRFSSSLLVCLMTLKRMGLILSRCCMKFLSCLIVRDDGRVMLVVRRFETQIQKYTQRGAP